MSNPIEKFRIETLEAYEEYKRTGECITREDANSWIDTLLKSTNNETPPRPPLAGGPRF